MANFLILLGLIYIVNWVMKAIIEVSRYYELRLNMYFSKIQMLVIVSNVF